MPKTKAQVKFDPRIKQFTKFVDRLTLEKIGETVSREMKKSIAKGISPVKGERKFERYKTQRSGDKRDYPRTKSVKKAFPTKRVRPVNLKLNGDYLKAFGFWVDNTNRIFVGLGPKQPSKKIKDMFETHNDGEHPHVPQRKHLPNKAGDKFKVAIEQKYVALFQKAVNDLIDKVNRS